MRTLSTAARAATMAEETAEVFLILLTITAGSTVIRVCNDNANLVSRGNTYLAYPFSLNVPDEWGHDDGPPPSVQLTIDALDGQIVAAVRSLAGGVIPTVLVEVLLRSQPSTVEASFDFRITAVDYDASSVTATLAYEPVLQQTIPGDAMDPTLFPGLFRS